LQEQWCGRPFLIIHVLAPTASGSPGTAPKVGRRRPHATGALSMGAAQSLSVEAARTAILSKAQRLHQAEEVALSEALGRTLATDLEALLTLPPTAVSAMDGYAVRSADFGEPTVALKLVGESAAGHGFAGVLLPGECTRIFTGAPVPQGADSILVQEEARVEGGFVIPAVPVAPGSFVRAEGLDFARGDVLLAAGTRLGPLEIALAAAMNHAKVPVVRRPRVAVLASGDELAPPGEAEGPGKIASSNSSAIAALVRSAGGEPLDLGIVADDLGSLEAAIERGEAALADVLVTLGGASVGDRDFVKAALARRGMELDFWRIAMRPGRPLIHGRLGTMLILGLPGNPVSAIVAGIVFLMPLLRALSGDPAADVLETESAVLGAALRANDGRKDFLRARLTAGETGLPVATPFAEQDSSLLKVLANAHCLLIREPHAPAGAPGDSCRILRLPGRR
jgi:molybdopterin molybdotransferase